MGHPGGALLRLDCRPPRVLPHRGLVSAEGDQEVPQAGVQDTGGLPGRPRDGRQVMTIMMMIMIMMMIIIMMMMILTS